MSNDQSFVGFHKFGEAGSFEVFEVTRKSPNLRRSEKGFYWWACQPGCLPDGEQHGPFPTAEGAYLDATQE